MSHLTFPLLAFSTNFCPFKSDLSGTTFWLQASDFKNSPTLTIFGIFNELLSTQNVNVACFARNDECDFLSDFQTLCSPWSTMTWNITSVFVAEPTSGRGFCRCCRNCCCCRRWRIHYNISSKWFKYTFFCYYNRIETPRLIDFCCDGSWRGTALHRATQNAAVPRHHPFKTITNSKYTYIPY